MARESGWLIERLRNSASEYWTGRISPNGPLREGEWSSQAAEGVRFARQDDAAIVLSWLFVGAGRVAEHLFVDSARQGQGDASRK